MELFQVEINRIRLQCFMYAFFLSNYLPSLAVMGFLLVWRAGWGGRIFLIYC